MELYLFHTSNDFVKKKYYEIREDELLPVLTKVFSESFALASGLPNQ